MWVTIYAAFMTMLLLACSILAMRKKDYSAGCVFASGAIILDFLTLVCLGHSLFYGAKDVALLVIYDLGFASIFVIAIYGLCDASNISLVILTLCLVVNHNKVETMRYKTVAIAMTMVATAIVLFQSLESTAVSRMKRSMGVLLTAQTRK